MSSVSWSRHEALLSLDVHTPTHTHKGKPSADISDMSVYDLSLIKHICLVGLRVRLNQRCAIC